MSLPAPLAVKSDSLAKGAPGESSAPPWLKLRLALLLFLGFAVLGSWLPVFSVHLKLLHFSPDEIAWAFATYSLSSFVTPLVWGQIADRWLAAERCISLCSLVVAALLWCLAQVAEPWAVCAVSLLYWFFMLPVLSLTTSLTFRQLEHPERDFGKVRLWGTMGWILAGLLLSFWLNSLKPLLFVDVPENDLTDSLLFAAAFAVALSAYSWTLPHTPPLRRRPAEGAGARHRRRWHRLVDAPVTALGLFRERAFVVYCVCLFGLYVTLPFSSQMAPLLLVQLGIAPDVLPIALTMQQSTEIGMLLALPWLLARLGQKGTMIVGLAAWTFGLTIYSIGQPAALVLVGMASHGVFICGFLVAGQVYANRQATHDIRASAQGFLVLISGSGLLLGNLLVGYLRELTDDDFRLAFLPAAVTAGIMAFVFILGFTPLSKPEPDEADFLVPDPPVA